MVEPNGENVVELEEITAKRQWDLGEVRDVEIRALAPVRAGSLAVLLQPLSRELLGL